MVFGVPLSPAVELVMTIDPPRPPSIRCGNVTLQVFQTPVRLMSIISRQASSDSSRAGASSKTPALASTMSSRPSCATPSSTAARRAAVSRTSACVATIRRSSFSTCRTVSARSSGVAGGYIWMLSTGPQRSTAMMSAPSWASRTAWLRPWLRAAPVMNATLPSTRPAMAGLPSLGGPPCVDRVSRPGDVAPRVGCQVEHGLAHVLRLHPRRLEQVERLEDVADVVPGRVLEVGPEEPVHVLVLDQRGVHVGGVDRVDPDPVRGQFLGQAAHEPDDAVLGGDVGGDVRHATQPESRADQDDRAAVTVGPEVRDDRLGREEDAGEVDLQHVPPLLSGGLGDLVRRDADPGVGGGDVETGQLGDAVREAGG